MRSGLGWGRLLARSISGLGRDAAKERDSEETDDGVTERGGGVVSRAARI